MLPFAVAKEIGSGLGEFMAKHFTSLQAAGLLREVGELVQPGAVRAAVEHYRRGIQPFNKWFKERIDTSDSLAETRSMELFEDYKRWCGGQGITEFDVMTPTMFGLTLGDRRISKKRNRVGIVIRRGVLLRA